MQFLLCTPDRVCIFASPVCPRVYDSPCAVNLEAARLNLEYAREYVYIFTRVCVPSVILVIVWFGYVFHLRTLCCDNTAFLKCHVILDVLSRLRVGGDTTTVVHRNSRRASGNTVPIHPALNVICNYCTRTRNRPAAASGNATSVSPNQLRGRKPEQRAEPMECSNVGRDGVSASLKIIQVSCC